MTEGQKPLSTTPCCVRPLSPLNFALEIKVLGVPADTALLTQVAGAPLHLDVAVSMPRLPQRILRVCVNVIPNDFSR